MAFGRRHTPSGTYLRFHLPATEKRDLPRALWFLAVAGVIFWLQFVPFLNTILLFLAIPFLPILLINVCMIGIVGEVLTGQVAKGWVVVPLFYILAYLALATISHVDMARLDSAIQQHNANQFIDFTATDVLLVRNGASDATVSNLLQDHDLSIIYEGSPNRRDRSLKSHRLAVGADCDRERQKTADVSISWFDEPETARPGRKSRGELVKDMCVIRQPSSVPPDAVTVEIKTGELDGSNFFLYTQQGSIKITGKDGKTANLIFAETYPLTWIPMPFFFCAREPRAPKDNCFGPFLRIFPTMLGGEDGKPASLIATSLGIRKASASSRRDAIRARQELQAEQP